MDCVNVNISEDPVKHLPMWHEFQSLMTVKSTNNAIIIPIVFVVVLPESLVLLISNLVPLTTTTLSCTVPLWKHFRDQIHVFGICQRCLLSTFMSVYAGTDHWHTR